MKINFDIDLEKLLLILVFLLGFLIGTWFEETFSNKYDVNQDGEINSQDYVVIKNYIMSK